MSARCSAATAKSEHPPGAELVLGTFGLAVVLLVLALGEIALRVAALRESGLVSCSAQGLRRNRGRSARKDQRQRGPSPHLFHQVKGAKTHGIAQGSCWGGDTQHCGARRC